MLLKGKVGLITGAALGIGRASAKLFAGEGVQVIVVDVNDKEGEKTVADIRKRGNTVTYIHAALRMLNEIRQMVNKAAAFLVSDEASTITGVTLPADSGFSAV